MSVEEIEQDIQRLSDEDLARLADWLSGHLASRTEGNPAGQNWQETPEQIAELERRLADFMADPTIAIPFEADYFDNLKRRLADERAQKASPR